ncbi:hypothetical protein REPUB_Repub12eG0179900 [Reevesia pubescens]
MKISLMYQCNSYFKCKLIAKEESPQVTIRTTRSYSASNNAVESTKPTESYKPTINDLVFRQQPPLSLEDLLSSFPVDVLKFLSFYAFWVHRIPPCFQFWSMEVLLLGKPVLLSRKNSRHSYSSVKRCEGPSDFVNYLCEALETVTDSLKANSGNLSSKVSGQSNGRTIYLVSDNLERVRDWDKSSTILPFLFNLGDILKMPEVGLRHINYLNIGYVEPIPLYFPDYTEGDLRQIFMANQVNRKLYTSFLDVVLRPFCRVTRGVDELSAAFSSLFKKYCEPLNDMEVAPNEDMKRRLFSHLRPHITSALNEAFQV